MPQTEEHPASDQTGGARSETASETTWSVPPGPARLLVAGEWVERQPDWRDQVTLRQCQEAGDVPMAWAIGFRDGYDQAISELREFAALLVDRLQLEQVYECAQRQVRRSA